MSRVERTAAEPNDEHVTTWRVVTCDGDSELIDALAETVVDGFMVHTIIALHETGFYKLVAHHTAWKPRERKAP